MCDFQSPCSIENLSKIQDRTVCALVGEAFKSQKENQTPRLARAVVSEAERTAIDARLNIAHFIRGPTPDHTGCVLSDTPSATNFIVSARLNEAAAAAVTAATTSTPTTTFGTKSTLLHRSEHCCIFLPSL